MNKQTEITNLSFMVIHVIQRDFLDKDTWSRWSIIWLHFTLASKIDGFLHSVPFQARGRHFLHGIASSSTAKHGENSRKKSKHYLDMEF